MAPAQMAALGLIPSSAHIGVVKSFNPVKGFGFITSQGIEGDLFFLRTELPAELHGGEGSALQGRQVTFELHTSKEGRSRAAHIQFLPTEGQPILGTIKSYSERNGYGFISTSSLSRDVHFKHYDVPPPFQGSDSNGLVGKRVTFQVEVLKDGKLKALQLHILDAPDDPAMPALGGHTQPSNAQLRGFVRSYDSAQGVGVLQAPGVAEEVPFQESLGFSPTPGQEVGFSLHWLSDGSMRAKNVSALLTTTNTVLFDGAELVGTVKSFHELKGFGFVNVPNQPEDLYFQRRDLTLELQTHMQQGASLVGATVHFRLEATNYGRWHARNVGLSQQDSAQPCTTALRCPANEGTGGQLAEGAVSTAAQMQMCDGAEKMGVIKSYNEAKGYGFVTMAGHSADLYFQTRDLAPRAQQVLQQQQGSLDIAGASVHFRLQALPDGRWHARSVEPVERSPLEEAWMPSDGCRGSAPEATAAVGLNSLGSLVDGTAMVGTVKSFNERNGYGFINAAGHSADIYFQPIDFDHETQQHLQRQGVGSIASGVAVHFWVQELPGDRWRARDVGLHSPLEGAGIAGAGIAEGGGTPADHHHVTPSFAVVEAPSSVLFDGAELLGTVKSYNEHKGYGFVNVDGEQVDLYFQTRDLTPDTRQQLQQQQGSGLVGSVVCFWLQALPDGRCGKWRARDVGLADAPPPRGEKRSLSDVATPEGGEGTTPSGPTPKHQRALLDVGASEADLTTPSTSTKALPSQAPPSTADGIVMVSQPTATDGSADRTPLSNGVPPRLSGIVKSFSLSKGFGFLTAQGFTEDVFFLRSELPGGLVSGHVDQGREVSFDLAFMPDGKLRASRITIHS